jgi:rhodanese-related sulfurtransferase
MRASTPLGRMIRRSDLSTALRPSPSRLDPEAIRALVAEGALLIDVRQAGDTTAALEGAARIAPDEIPGRLGEFSRHTPIILACT